IRRMAPPPPRSAAGLNRVPNSLPAPLVPVNPTGPLRFVPTHPTGQAPPRPAPFNPSSIGMTPVQQPMMTGISVQATGMRNPQGAGQPILSQPTGRANLALAT